MVRLAKKHSPITQNTRPINKYFRSLPNLNLGGKTNLYTHFIV